MLYKPVIGITMGDAAGVGPEVVLKALRDPAIYEACSPLVVGDLAVLRRDEAILSTGLELRRIESPAEALCRAGTVDCLDLGLLPGETPFGRVSAEAGEAAYRYVQRAVELALAGELDAICTAPLNKEALYKAERMFPGHTEILAALTGVEDYAMMLTAPGLRVIHVTTHVGLLDAIERIVPERVYTVIRLAHDALRKGGMESPRIAVCGVNPHAGENGLFGRGEEEEKVVPGVERAQREGFDVVGPLPADTLFFRAVRGDFDVIVAQYHDQGHGPIKVLGLDAGVNVTLGLPIVRTSVDHGTAFDIAGKGKASELSMVEAIRQAVELAPKR